MQFGDLAIRSVFMLHGLDDPQSWIRYARQYGFFVGARWVKTADDSARPLRADTRLLFAYDTPVEVPDILCGACQGRGYLVVQDPAGRPAIARCHICAQLSGADPAVFANADGIGCRLIAPHMLFRRSDAELLRRVEEPVRAIELDPEGYALARAERERQQLLQPEPPPGPGIPRPSRERARDDRETRRARDTRRQKAEEPDLSHLPQASSERFIQLD